MYYLSFYEQYYGKVNDIIDFLLETFWVYYKSVHLSIVCAGEYSTVN